MNKEAYKRTNKVEFGWVDECENIERKEEKRMREERKKEEGERERRERKKV